MNFTEPKQMSLALRRDNARLKTAIATTPAVLIGSSVYGYNHMPKGYRPNKNKKRLEKKASTNPLYMTRRLGTRYSKFGGAGRSGFGGVGIGMPGASGTGITPQSSESLYKILNASSKPVKIEGSLSSKQAAKTNGVNKYVTKI